MVFLLITATVIPLMLIQVQALLSAGPNQKVYTGQTTNLNGTTTDNATLITLVTWNFGDNSTVVNGTSPTLLKATHIYTSPGIYNATLTVSFGGTLNKTETAIATITVAVNKPPVANAGPDQVVEQTSPHGATITLDGTRSYDPDNDTLTYTWTWTGGSASGAKPAVLMPAGISIVTLTVSDGQLTASDTVSITVQDTTPPEISATGTPGSLWPPNHKYVEAKTEVTASDIADPSPKVTLVSVTSNEPDNAAGDGNTIDDIIILGNFVFNLRAERSGTGGGRTYTITYKATDASGNFATTSVTVKIPHNK